MDSNEIYEPFSTEKSHINTFIFSIKFQRFHKWHKGATIAILTKQRTKVNNSWCSACKRLYTAIPKIWFLLKEFFGKHTNLRDRQKLKTQLYKMVEKCTGKWRWKPDECHINLIEVGKVTNRRDVLCIPQTLEAAMWWS